MSEKFCIFCGEKPKDKNQEHVVPQWLIHMTKREKGDVFSLYPDAKMHLPFMRFTFPACTECNSKYSRMEAMVKPVLERVLSGQSISGADASLLMDWFDKVRIGLWLSNMYYNPKLKQAIGYLIFIISSAVYENVSGQIEGSKKTSISFSRVKKGMSSTKYFPVFSKNFP